MKEGESKMYEVYLIAEDGEYCISEPMQEDDAVAWIEDNEWQYGEGQELVLRYYQY